MALLRLFLIALAALAVGALVGLLVGLAFGMPGDWYWWAAGGALFAGAVIAWFLWDLSRGPNIIASALLACVVTVFLLQPGTALADSEARQGADSVRLTLRPCADEQVIAHLQAAGEDPLDYRAAHAELSGQGFDGCWKPFYSRGVVLLRYTDGDQGYVPFDELKPVRDM